MQYFYFLGVDCIFLEERRILNFMIPSQADIFFFFFLSFSCELFHLIVSFPSQENWHWWAFWSISCLKALFSCLNQRGIPVMNLWRVFSLWIFRLIPYGEVFIAFKETSQGLRGLEITCPVLRNSMWFVLHPVKPLRYCSTVSVGQRD